ncbi:BON domain-containing protein [Actinoplanes sp. CA-252034]|uniref:BON domain-containing protein n=1 Tax=Actinoplanes sp. CA-252034 TaxID=3239906 RepID=UPI003D99054A
MTQTLHKTDEQLKTAVTDELKWSTPGVNETSIGVAVNHGAVTLSGEVESWPEKRLAEHAALRVRGVTAVAAEITVRNSWSGVNDTDIAREASEALERCIIVPAGKVTATVHEHTINLHGQVTWHYQREAAEHAVHHLKGVVKVYNAITLKPVASATDIKATISAALVRTAQSEGRDITVSVDLAGGHVTLEGLVQSWSERSEVERAAWSVPGVTNVTNALRIHY